MTTGRPAQSACADAGVADLEKLAAELDGKTYVVSLLTASGRRPCLAITNRDATRLADYVYSDGEWFWWGWAQRIAPVTDVTGAAAAVDRVLRIFGDRGPASMP